MGGQGTSRYESLQKYYDGEESYAVMDDFSSDIDSKWNFEYLGTNFEGLERYYIRSTANGMYLGLSGTSVDIGVTALADCIWLMVPVTGGYRVQSEYNTSYYLHNNNGSLGLTTNQSSAGAVWELLWEPTFVPLTNFELDSEWLEAGQAKQFEIETTPTHASYPNASNFTWSFSNSDFTVNSAGYVTADTYDGDYSYLTLTHKYTGVSETFLIVTDLDFSGNYFIRNRHTMNLMDIEGTITQSGAIIEQRAFSAQTQQLWYFEEQSNRTYLIRSTASGMMLKLNTDDSIAQTNSLSSSCYWYVFGTEDGNYRISSAGNIDYSIRIPSVSVSTSLTPNGYSSANGQNLLRQLYTNDSNYCDEWDIIPNIYGMKEFRELTSAQMANINCHGYAMWRDKTPDPWTTRADDYRETKVVPYHVFGEEISDEFKNGIATEVNRDFDDWLRNTGYNFVDEPTFSSSSSSILANNQYRVVLRTGTCDAIFYDMYGNLIYYEAFFDYHFWYQLYDGTWANKHGEAGVPEWLGEDVTPFSTSTSGWNVEDNDNFYDSPIYSYIITTN